MNTLLPWLYIPISILGALACYPSKTLDRHTYRSYCFPMKKMNRTFTSGLFACLFLAISLIPACVRLQPGADPFVVNAERIETVAAATFDLVLKVDDSNRPLFKEQVPKYHEFCEWLRAPQVIWVTNTAPRSLAMIINLNNVKDAYKKGLATSNVLNGVSLALNQTYIEANSWLPVITNLPAAKGIKFSK